MDDKGETKGKLSAGINVGFFKIDSEIEKKMKKGKVDPFKVMEREFIQLNEKGIKPILIIDELQALDKIYLENGRDRRLIIELFNFFAAMTKESHLAHIIIASSDGYFINTVYNDSRLKKTSEFYKVDYLPKEDVMEWLLNLEKYSKIKELLRDMVRNNILYFDPTEAIYYPQGKSYQWGIKLFFESPT